MARVRTMEEILSRSMAAQNFNALVMSIFACSALLLAAIGIYGLMSHSVVQRAQEIGIRLALGAESSHIRNMVVFQGLRPALAGVVCGLVAAFGLTRFIASFLFGVKAWDPLVFFVVPVILIGVALVAVWLPAIPRFQGTNPLALLQSGDGAVEGTRTETDIGKPLNILHHRVAVLVAFSQARQYKKNWIRHIITYCVVSDNVIALLSRDFFSVMSRNVRSMESLRRRLPPRTEPAAENAKNTRICY